MPEGKQALHASQALIHTGTSTKHRVRSAACPCGCLFYPEHKGMRNPSAPHTSQKSGVCPQVYTVYPASTDARPTVYERSLSPLQPLLPWLSQCATSGSLLVLALQTLIHLHSRRTIQGPLRKWTLLLLPQCPRVPREKRRKHTAQRHISDRPTSVVRLLGSSLILVTILLAIVSHHVTLSRSRS